MVSRKLRASRRFFDSYISFSHDAITLRKSRSESDRAVISGLVPMIHVQDIERSAAFYRLLGFEIGNYVPPSGTKEWAWLYSVHAADWKRGPNLMLTRTGRAIDPGAQDVLLYLYASDLKALRRALLANGIAAGEIDYPEYLPEGEFRLTDSDGYVLMIAQSAAATP
jgi:catechol 2,3-dioxygenase-like lactoylglutathione lyase family enzyme